MPISNWTANVIETNDVRCEAGGPDKDGKWTGWIMKDVDRWFPLLNSEPIYDDKKQAVAAMQSIVDQIRAKPITQDTENHAEIK